MTEVDLVGSGGRHGPQAAACCRPTKGRARSGAARLLSAAVGGALAAPAGAAQLVELNLHCPAITDAKCPPVAPVTIATRPVHAPIAAMLKDNTREAADIAAKAQVSADVAAGVAAGRICVPCCMRNGA
jgi:hypothetical protein